MPLAASWRVHAVESHVAVVKGRKPSVWIRLYTIPLVYIVYWNLWAVFNTPSGIAWDLPTSRASFDEIREAKT